MTRVGEGGGVSVGEFVAEAIDEAVVDAVLGSIVEEAIAQRFALNPMNNEGMLTGRVNQWSSQESLPARRVIRQSDLERQS